MTGQLHHTTNVHSQEKFEQQYISLRQKEGRVYSDGEVLQLPFLPKNNPLKKEWAIRRFSSKKLITYLTKKKKPLSILEVGCGNGWLSAKLASIKNATGTGLDINELELAQAKRIFSKLNLSFIHGDIRNDIDEESYDIIVFAASFQYFLSVQEILNSCLSHLKKGGEIHITDTQFYTKEEAFKAKKRSLNYFNEAGFPSMSNYYFHHELDELARYNYAVLYAPNQLVNKLFKRSPFPWICIKK